MTDERRAELRQWCLEQARDNREGATGHALAAQNKHRWGTNEHERKSAQCAVDAERWEALASLCAAPEPPKTCATCRHCSLRFQGGTSRTHPNGWCENDSAPVSGPLPVAFGCVLHEPHPEVR